MFKYRYFVSICLVNLCTSYLKEIHYRKEQYIFMVSVSLSCTSAVIMDRKKAMEVLLGNPFRLKFLKMSARATILSRFIA